MKKSIALFFGSFNPVHTGHLIVAQHVADRSDIDEVWFVVSPHNPLKSTDELAAASHRMEMVKLAIKNNRQLKPCAIEMELPLPSYTENTLKVLTSNFPKFKFTLLVGEDQLYTFQLWKNYTSILEKFQLLVYPRLHSFSSMPDVIDWTKQDIIRIDAPRFGLSSTAIREKCKSGLSIRYLVPDTVQKYINRHKIY